MGSRFNVRYDFAPNEIETRLDLLAPLRAAPARSVCGATSIRARSVCARENNVLLQLKNKLEVFS